MDLSWCIICDRHCIEENLYCSESCRIQDVNHKHTIVSTSATNKKTTTTALCSPPASPLLDPYFSSFNHDRRTSITISKSSTRTTVPADIFGYMSPSSVPRYSLSD